MTMQNGVVSICAAVVPDSSRGLADKGENGHRWHLERRHWASGVCTIQNKRPSLFLPEEHRSVLLIRLEAYGWKHKGAKEKLCRVQVPRPSTLKAGSGKASQGTSC